MNPVLLRRPVRPSVYAIFCRVFLCSYTLINKKRRNKAIIPIIIPVTTDHRNFPEVHPPEGFTLSFQIHWPELNLLLTMFLASSPSAKEVSTGVS